MRMLQCMGHVLVALAGASSCEEHETVRWGMYRLALARAAALVGELRDDAIAPPRHDVIAPAHFGAIVYAVAPPWQEPGWKANIGPLRRVASFDALFRPEHFANLEPEKISALQQLKEVSTLLRRSHLWSHCASYVAFVWRRISPSVALLAMLAVCWRHAARVLPASVWSVLVFTTAGCGVM